jgi:hypothetical protein
MIVNMLAIGSETGIGETSYCYSDSILFFVLQPCRRLPTGLLDTGDLALPCQFPETQTAHAKTAKKCPRAAAQMATIMLTHGELGRLLGLIDKRFLGHNLYVSFLI